jgi:hypothetical protein
LCLCIGIATTGLGIRGLGNIAVSYDPDDILYDDGPELFQVWLRREHRQGSLDADSVARRILTMPIGRRRATVIAMMRPDYLAAASGSEAERRELLARLEAGIVKALSTAPTAGDLWLAASKVRSQISGFDRKAESYLAASYLTAPREGDVALIRHVYASAVTPLMRTPMTSERDRDRAIVETLQPAFGEKVDDWLDRTQEGLPDGLRR